MEIQSFVPEESDVKQPLDKIAQVEEPEKIEEDHSKKLGQLTNE